MTLLNARKLRRFFLFSEAKYRALVENTDDAILLTDLRGKHIYRNPAYFKSLGFEQNEEVDFRRVCTSSPDDLPHLKEQIVELYKTGTTTNEYRVKHRNGTWIYRFARSTLIYNKDHQPYAIITIIRDITQRKKAEETLLLSEENRRNLINDMVESAWVIDFEGNFVDVNDTAVRALGYFKRRVVVFGNQRH